MENPLPEIAELIGDDITEGDFKVALVKLRAYLDELLGVNGEGHNVVPASVGSATKPVYTDANKNIVASDATVGATNKPVYMENGEIKAISGNIGSASQPVYIANGVLTAVDAVMNIVEPLSVGAYALGGYKGGTASSAQTYAAGTTRSGSSIYFGTNVSSSHGFNPADDSNTGVTGAGTWKLMCRIKTNRGTSTSTHYPQGLWQRIA